MDDPWADFKPAPTQSDQWADFKPAGTQAAPEQPKGIWERLRDAVYVPKASREAMPGVGELLTSTPGAMIGEMGNAASQFGTNITKPQAFAGPIPVQTTMDALNLLFSPVTGAAKNLLGRPVESATGIHRDITGNVATALIPFGGAGKASKVAGAAESLAKPAATVEATAAAMTPEAAYAAKVARLKAQGVEPTLGQGIGGQARRAEEASKSDPLVGGAIRKQEQTAIDSFNKTLYNKVLEPLGQDYKGKIVGREGVKDVGDRVSSFYEKLKPKMSMVPDDELIDGLAGVRTNIAELPPAQQAQFEAILNNRVLHRLGKTGALDGEVFKTVESEVSKLARDYKGAPDPAMRNLGYALEDVNGLLRDNLARTSDASVRADLQKANTSWALLARLEDAAQARKGGAGVVTPGDLLGSIRKMDKSVRNRTFARGDAQLQSFAEDAHDVLGNKVPDSGTPERLAINHHGLLMYAASKLTNPLASAAMGKAKKGGPLFSMPPLPRRPGLPLLLMPPQESQQ